jgi:hypothetical protein
MTCHTRLTTLAAHCRQQRPLAHCTGVVRIPHDIPDEAWDAWLVSQPCAWGQRYCEQRRVGVPLPETCASPEAWDVREGRRMEEQA